MLLPSCKAVGKSLFFLTTKIISMYLSIYQSIDQYIYIPHIYIYVYIGDEHLHAQKHTCGLHQYNMHVKCLCAQQQTTSLGSVCEPSTFPRGIGNPPVCLSVPGRRAGTAGACFWKAQLASRVFLHHLRRASLLLGLMLTSGGYAVAVCMQLFLQSFLLVFMAVFCKKYLLAILLCQGDLTLGHA